MSLNQPEYAGSWYPRQSQECQALFTTFEEETVLPNPPAPLVGGVVPHAGWFFSGSIAYSVFHALAKGSTGVETVVLFGGHLSGEAPARLVTRGEAWTPLGPLPIDEEVALDISRKIPIAIETPDTFPLDNTFELSTPIY